MSSTFVLPFPTQRLNKSSQIGLEIFKGCLLSLNFVQFGYNRSRLKYRCFNLERKILKTYALSFYRSKMIFDRPNCFGRVQVVLVGYKLFWSGPNCFGQVSGPSHFGQVQIKLFWTSFYNLDLSKMIWTQPKRIGTRPKLLDIPKSFWTISRRTRH